MNVQCQAIEFFNPGQIPVTAVDAPLYAIAELMQWKWPDTHGEDKYKYSLIPIPYNAMASQVQPHSNPLQCNGFTSTASFQSLMMQWLHKYSLNPIPYNAMVSQVQPHSTPLQCNGFTSTASFQSLTMQWLHKYSFTPILTMQCRPKNNTQKLSGQFVRTNQSLPGH